MNLSSKQLIVGGMVVAALIGGAAVASSYMTRDALQPTPKAATHTAIRTQPQTTQMVAAQPSLPPCDDKNIVGTVGGALAGGVIGNQFGSGKGRTAATVGGALGGAYLGNQYLPTRNATCR